MTCSLAAARDADLSYGFTFPSSFDLTGYTAVLKIYATLGGTLLLTITGTANGNGSVLTVLPDDYRVNVFVSKTDINTLPAASPVTDISILQHDLLLTAGGVTTKFTGGVLKVLPLGSKAPCTGGDIAATIGGTDVSVELNGIGLGANLAGLSAATGLGFLARTGNSTYAPRTLQVSTGVLVLENQGTADNPTIGLGPEMLDLGYYGDAGRTLNDKLTGVNEAQDFLGPLVDPTDILTDWQPAINIALLASPTAVVSASWRTILPPSYRRINGPLIMSRAGSILEGHGIGTTLYAPTHNFNMVETTAGNCKVQDLRILTDAHGASQHFGLHNIGSGLRIRDVDFVNLYSAVNHETVNLIMESCTWQGLKPSLGLGLRINHAGANVLLNDLMGGDGSNFPGSNCYAGIYYIQGGCLQISNSQFYKMGTVLYAQPGAAQTAGSIYVVNTQFDTSVYGVILDGTVGYVTVPKFVGCWMNGHTTHGIWTKGDVTQLTMTGVDASANGSYGRLYEDLAGFEDVGGTGAFNASSGCRMDNVHNGTIEGSYGVMGAAGFVGGLPGNGGYGLEITNNGASAIRARIRANGNTLGTYSNLSLGADISITA